MRSCQFLQWGNSLTHLNTLTDINVHYCGVDREIVKLGWWVQAALSRPTLKTFVTSIPFFVLPHTISPSLECVEYVHFCGCFISTFCCIAEMCKMPSMKSLLIAEFLEHYYYPVISRFVVILNSSLRNNSSWTIEFEDFFLQCLPSYQHVTLSRALRTDPNLLSLKRSKSLSYLSTDLYSLNDEQIHSMYGCEPNWGKLTRSQSCPKLLHMQALHNMHPQLHETLYTWKLYFGAKLKYKDMANYLQSKEHVLQLLHSSYM